MADWRDIATAPKDGTNILVTDGSQIAVMYWVKGDRPGDWRWQGWLLAAMDYGDSGKDHMDELTHWQPLPALPIQGSD